MRTLLAAMVVLMAGVASAAECEPSTAPIEWEETTEGLHLEWTGQFGAVTCGPVDLEPWTPPKGFKSIADFDCCIGVIAEGDEVWLQGHETHLMIEGVGWWEISY